ncbi:MAG: radical SAM protein [Bacteroidales bacterium]|nr:radical SAM protein [Bacteroidales bacterium]
MYWETKRGCPYKCGFCEWGNAIVKVMELPKDRLLNEIELFKESTVSEINILDGTFNWGKNYLFYFAELLKSTTLKITCQVRFESLLTKHGNEFFELVKSNRDRIHLEFGLQTIHPEEMKTISRINDLDKN